MMIHPLSESLDVRPRRSRWQNVCYWHGDLFLVAGWARYQDPRPRRRANRGEGFSARLAGVPCALTAFDGFAGTSSSPGRSSRPRPLLFVSRASDRDANRGCDSRTRWSDPLSSLAGNAADRAVQYLERVEALRHLHRPSRMKVWPRYCRTLRRFVDRSPVLAVYDAIA